MLKNVKSECWKFCYIYEIGGSRCSSWWEGCVGTVGALGGKGPGGEGGECGVGRGVRAYTCIDIIYITVR